MRTAMLLPFAACLTLLPGAAVSVAGAEAPDARVRSILRAHCGACHGPGGSGKGGFDYVLDRERLVAREQVVPGKPEDSPLLRRVVDGEMPPGRRPRPGPADVAELRRWIDAGAPAGGAVRPTTLTEGWVIGLLRADLEALPARRRPFTRYLTLAPLANAGADEETRKGHRDALAKLVNSLSWHPRVTPPTPVDDTGAVFRLDLRDYNWTARMWERLVAVYPYRLDEAGRAAGAFRELTGTPQPQLRGDWFVASASRPPFYHDFLQLPGTDRALERLLRVDVAANLRDDNAVRAGFNGSGVARNNRVIERHDAAHGAYWRSYDFAENTGRQNVFERPLGPLPGAAGFVAAGGELLFHLPNGLQGYLLVDGQGRRVDRAPGDIVSDPDRPDRLVETGLSCMSCHVRGLLPKDDQIRPHVLKNGGTFAAEERAAVLALYAPPARMRRLMEEDMERFGRAMRQAGVRTGGPEPVREATRRYEAPLDLRRAAAEVGLAPDELASRLGRSPQRFRSLAALRARGGTVQRQVFEEAYPDLARALRLGEDAPADTTTAGATPILRGHRGSVHDLAFAPDGRSAASAGEDRTVRLWDLVRGEQRCCLEGHADEATCVAFVADGGRLLSGCRDRTLRLWELSSGKEVRRFVGHTDAIHAVAVAADGRLAVSGGDDRTLRVWDVESGKELRCLTGHTAAITCVALTADGRVALSGDRAGGVRLWDVKAGRARGGWRGHGGAVYAVALSPDGRLAASGGAGCVLRLWDAASGAERRRGDGYANPIVRLAFTSDGKRVLAGSSRSRTPGGLVRSWEIVSGAAAWRVEDEAAGPVDTLAFSRDGRRVLLALPGGELRLLSLDP